MKKLVFIFCLLFFGCQPKPEFYIDGKPFYTKKRCLETITTSVWEYHFGYNYFNGEFEWHYGKNIKTECLKYVIDTIEINQTIK